MANIKSKVAKGLANVLGLGKKEVPRAVGKAQPPRAKPKLADKISSIAGTNFDDARTATGKKSKGLMVRADGSAYSHMGDGIINVADNRSQFKGAAKAAAVFGSVAAYDKLTKKEKTKFEKAFSAAHNSGEETFSFDGKSYTTEVKKGTSPKKKNKNSDEVVPRKKPTPPAKDEQNFQNMINAATVTRRSSKESSERAAERAVDEKLNARLLRESLAEKRLAAMDNKNKGGMATKSNKGHMDYRKGGLVLSSIDNRKKKK
jgi:hypothetical protein